MSRNYPMRNAGNRGFSLVEAIVVMAILSIVMLAIMSFIIPTQQSMKMQSNVTDVQSNLNLALNVLSRDLLMAGFLVDPAFDPPITHANCPPYWKGDTSTDDMAPGPIFWQRHDPVTNLAFTVNNPDSTDLTIRTRIIGNSFAVRNADAASTTVTVTHGDMADNFCNCVDTNGDGIWNSCSMKASAPRVRIFNPVTMSDPNCAPGNYDCELVPLTIAASLLTVTACSAGNTADSSDDNFTVGQAVAPAAVIVGTRDDVLPMQTIRYRVANGALERIVNGSRQVLARGVTSINFAYGKSSGGAIKRVDVTVTGVIAAMKQGEAQLGQKTRTLTTSVNMRNSF